MAEAVDIPAGVLQAHYASNLNSSERRRDDADIAIARARDTALHGLKVVEAVSAKELLVSDDPAEMSRLNSAVRVPTTLDHPNAVVKQ
jgi:hypothetical protein